MVATLFFIINNSFTLYLEDKNYLMLRVLILVLVSVLSLAGNYITVVNSTGGIAAMEKVCSDAPT